MLKESANSKHRKYGNRFNEPLKLFSFYLFIVGGRLTYEVLYSNLSSALPSITTLNRLIDEGSKIVEGVPRFLELKNYLIKKNYKLQVFIGEDQTAIIRRIYYDPKINEMVGFVLPVSEKTAFPITKKFSVCSLADIKNAFDNEEMSKNAYVYMPQPLHDKSPAFCLVIFGRGNSFKLNKSEITIFGFSSDADPRCLKAMRIQSGLLSSTSLENKDSPYRPYFQCKYDIHSPVYIQDAVHIGTKMKTRLLKPNVVLPMGRFFVSKDFIEKLIQTYPKNQHFLYMTYLKSQDKMNFQAIDKMTANCVTDLLQELPGSEAFFLDIGESG
ncbi:hypothetical protein RN001_010711 [Aquatica leii]|uniref:Uncharacterized protein n=1 Tax=Aquatica leii TaxID=1421715 RepID=A0AAN7SQG1_9COLE|nr:hypothetical protein RN001_010711 [Aquatica leii]